MLIYQNIEKLLQKVKTIILDVSISFPVIYVVEHFAISEAERPAEKVLERNL